MSSFSWLGLGLFGVVTGLASACGQTSSSPGSGGTRPRTGGATDGSGGTQGASGSAGAPVLSGGTSSEGGTAAGGNHGGSNDGGLTSDAGAATSGGSTVSSGGAATSGGSTAGGGVTTSGGTSDGGTVGNCARKVGSCSAPTVRVTEVELGIPVTPYGDQGDSAPLPLAIAAMPSGGSRVAWLGTDNNVYVAKLDCDDHLVEPPFSFPGVDLQDLVTEDYTGIVLLTRDATGSGSDHCGSGQLCSGISSPCREMVMVRFGNDGQLVWETQVTNLSSTLDGYQDGARFVWSHPHHGQLAVGPGRHAAYFGVSVTSGNGACVDITAGDRMQVVVSAGVSSKLDGFDFGCSHPSSSRLIWDDRKERFIALCATSDDCRIVQPNPDRTIATGTCDGSFFGGDVVLSSGVGYWTAWSQGGTLRLQHFTDDGPDSSITDAGNAAHSHLVSLGPNHMLLGWDGGSAMQARVHDSGSGQAVGAQFTIPVSDHRYQAFKAYADGSAAYPAAGSRDTSIKIARVMPCQ